MAYLSSEGNHVVLAERENINVLDNHHLVVICMKGNISS